MRVKPLINFSEVVVVDAVKCWTAAHPTFVSKSRTPGLSIAHPSSLLLSLMETKKEKLIFHVDMFRSFDVGDVIFFSSTSLGFIFNSLHACVRRVQIVIAAFFHRFAAREKEEKRDEKEFAQHLLFDRSGLFYIKKRKKNKRRRFQRANHQWKENTQKTNPRRIWEEWHTQMYTEEERDAQCQTTTS